jgi:hypothetical protein
LFLYHRFLSSDLLADLNEARIAHANELAKTNAERSTLAAQQQQLQAELAEATAQAQALEKERERREGRQFFLFRLVFVILCLSILLSFFFNCEISLLIDIV